MILQRLSWAGVFVQSGDTSILIDPIANVTPEFAQLMGHPLAPLVSLEQMRSVSAVLVTHLHPDHFDPQLIAGMFGDHIPVYLPNEAVLGAPKTSLQNVNGMAFDQQEKIGSLQITAVYSADGFGFPQVAWIVEGGGKKMIHCGDTLWHGHWWRIAQKYGPFDAACLPVNGAVVQYPGLIPSGVEACLTPEQAASAASILRSGQLVPIHYQEFDNPPLYCETPNLLVRLTNRAKELDVPVRLMKPGDRLQIGE
ncbi:MBL fold metallo-hydrolase [Effusibacillus dendaii]|uniref:Metallo-beta-lactamase domain-containing protein n=1 Tax=Effusibacillus dendaii TaxID=2743772 RepID=A0A7I8DBC8_9BACL|nr:MBL fold metallo-hydrolase [Effusibacillus dendaii]BCJ85231.1 hypothetical protein skT53_02160 [Effusibacillus dendaii]